MQGKISNKLDSFTHAVCASYAAKISQRPTRKARSTYQTRAVRLSQERSAQDRARVAQQIRELSRRRTGLRTKGFRYDEHKGEWIHASMR